MKRLILIIYDIPDNKRRSKFVKLIQSYGHRVQKSAFEAILTESKYNKLLRDIPKYIKAEDNIRVYRLNSDVKIDCWGSIITPIPDDIIVV